MKFSEIAKDLGFTMAEMVFYAREKGMALDLAKPDMDARTVALVRATLHNKARLKSEDPDLLDKIKAGGTALKEASPKATRRIVVKDPNAPKPPPKPRKKKEEAPAPVATAPAPAPAAPPPSAPAKPPLVSHPKVPVSPKKPPTKRKEKEVKLSEIQTLVGGPAKPAAPPPPKKEERVIPAGVDLTPAKKPIIEISDRAKEDSVKIVHPSESRAAEQSDSALRLKGKVHPKPPERPRPGARPPPRPNLPPPNVLNRARPRPPKGLLDSMRPRPKPLVAPGDRKIQVSVPITLKNFSQETGIKINDIIRKLMDNGVMATINSVLDEDAVLMMSLEFKREIEIRKEEKLEETVVKKVADKAEDLKPRAPIVTFMGHVDHGKTSLLDKIRNTDVAAGEAGGITQHIGAYKIKTAGGKEVVFLDTPGHEAFTAMRARGANVTDIVVLVVAADDGVMRQTEEAISHARAANVPIVVAINKCDRPNANVNKVKQQLSAVNLIPEDWSGNTTMVEVSAITGQGVAELVELLALQADLLDLKANPARAAEGRVLEVEKSDAKGVIAHVLVQHGTLRKGDVLICGSTWGRVRSLVDDHGRRIETAPPATPVEMAGLENPPTAGDHFQVVESVQAARELAEERGHKQRETAMLSRQRVTLENIYDQIESGKLKELRVVLKADVAGSVEVLSQTLSSLVTEELKLQLVHAQVGNINESDVLLADASNAIIIGFQVVVEDRAAVLAKEKGVQVRTHDVIYALIEEVKAALEGLLEPEKVEKITGKLTVKEIFSISRLGSIAGCVVNSGKIERSSQIRLYRAGKLIHSGKVGSLRRFKDDVKEVAEGMECGVKLDNYDRLEKNDVIEAFTIELIPRKVFTRS